MAGDAQPQDGEDDMELDYEKLPERFREAMRAYVERRVWLSATVRFALEDDYRSALLGCDDDTTLEELRALARWIHGELPARLRLAPLMHRVSTHGGLPPRRYISN